MARSIIADIKRSEELAQTARVERNLRAKEIAVKIGRSLGYIGVSLLVTPTARTAHSPLGLGLRQAMGSSVPQAVNAEMTANAELQGLAGAMNFPTELKTQITNASEVQNG